MTFIGLAILKNMRNKTVLIVVLFISMIAGVCESAEFYISPDGSDSNVGTKSSPFATLEGARDAVRAIVANDKLSSTNITVWLRGGIYPLSTTFELDRRDSGTKGNPVVWKGCPGENVRISGGKIIPCSLVKVVTDQSVLARIPGETRGKVYEIDLKSIGLLDYGQILSRGFRRPYIPSSMEIFIDDKPMFLSQWPNPGQPRISIGKVFDQGSIPRNGDFSDRGAVFAYSIDRPDRWKQARDVWIYGLFNKGYADDMVKVAEIDNEKKRIKTAQATMYGFASGKSFRSWVAKNLLEEIDIPGEYFIERETGVLYFMPPENTNLKNARIEVSILQSPLLAIEDVSFVHFEDMTFECSRGIGVYVEGGQGCTIAGSVLRNLGMVAVCVGQGTEDLENYAHEGTALAASRRLGSWHEHIYGNTAFNRNGGKEHTILGCDIYNIGSGGISLGGGDRKTLTAAGNSVINCDIYNFNRLDASYKGAVNIDGVGNRIANCRIHDCPDTAIYLHGNDHVIEYNEVGHAVMYADEHGAFYMGRDPSEYGNVIRYNWFHDIGKQRGGHGAFILHFDDGATGTHVYGNVFSDNASYAVRMNGAVDNLFENNIFFRTLKDISNGSWNGRRWYDYMRNETQRKRLREDIDILKPPFSQRYPDLVKVYSSPPKSPRPNLIRNNVSINSNAFRQSRNNTLVNNMIDDKDPGFIDVADNNFQLRDDSLVYKKIPGFQKIPFEKIGLYQDRYREVDKSK